MNRGLWTLYRVRLVAKAIKWRFRLRYASPDRRDRGHLPSLYPDQLLDDTYRALVSTVFDAVKRNLFPYRLRYELQFDVQVEDDAARKFCECVLSAHGYIAQEVFGMGHDFIGCLRLQSDRLVGYGVSYNRLKWKVHQGQRFGLTVDENHSDVELPLIIPIFHGVVPIRRRGQPPTYRIMPSKAHWWHENGAQPLRSYELFTDDMLVFKSEGRHRKYPPLSNLIDDYWREQVAMRKYLAATYMMARPDDQGLLADIARYRSQSIHALLREQRLSHTRNFERVGAPLVEQARFWSGLSDPATDYYLAWQCIDAYKGLARLRQSMLDQFAHQVLDPMLRRNGLSGPVALRAQGMLNETQLDDLFMRFTEEHLTLDELWQLASHPKEMDE